MSSKTSEDKPHSDRDGKFYTSTREGFQEYMRDALADGDVEDFVQRSTAEDFLMVYNGKRFDHAEYIEFLRRARVGCKGDAPYQITVNELLRDEDRLAARMTGTMSFQGNRIETEIFMFCTVAEDGRVRSLRERAGHGPEGKEKNFNAQA